MQLLQETTGPYLQVRMTWSSRKETMGLGPGIVPISSLHLSGRQNTRQKRKTLELSIEAKESNTAINAVLEAYSFRAVQAVFVRTQTSFRSSTRLSFPFFNFSACRLRYPAPS